MKLKRSLHNVFWGVLSQVIILTLGLIIPRLFIGEYGSEINGLFSSVNQLFGYIALLEAGIGAATVQALYKPITFNNNEDISEVLSATNKYYKKISLYYLLCIVFLSIIYPLFVNTIISKFDIGIIIFLQGVPGVLNFYFQATLKQLLIAEGKNYIDSNINMFVYIAISIAKIILILNGSNIILIQCAYFLVSILQMAIYYIYFKKYYKWVNLKSNPNYGSLKQKNSFLIHQISLLIFSSTDMIVLSIFCDFKAVSVYAIYNLIFTSINSLIGTIHNSASFVLGHTYHENKKKYIKLHDTYDNYYIAFIFAMMSISLILIIPFIKMYTNGISDINYIDPTLAVLFCVIQLMTCTRVVSNNLIRIAGHMKQTISRTILESTINLGASLILVNFIGIYGVLIATIIALLYRTTDIIFYANRKILKRSPKKVYKTILINTILFIFIILLTKIVSINITNYLNFILYGFILSCIILPVFFIVNSIFDREAFIFILDIIKKKISI